MMLMVCVAMALTYAMMVLMLVMKTGDFAVMARAFAVMALALVTKS